MAQPTPHSNRSQKRQLVKVKPKPFAVAQPIKNMEFKKIYREVEEGRKSEYIMQSQQMQKLMKGTAIIPGVEFPVVVSFPNISIMSRDIIVSLQ
ncbi:hypothetical protein BDU57DRAFT_538638 [Ampelomyces quisqualis]|uniref:Uncharacterized protein n=1 Tax=Ampelomyces quisqualis TaxID=50730 RepID=A0A6A5QP75_AMPQU|nr:hypothetical protein BDU57DRAFT_538638 [Ampelomyces quisqualis]